MQEPTPTTSPVLRQFELLELLAGAGRALALAEVVAASGWPKPSVHRMLAQLEASGPAVVLPAGRGLHRFANPGRFLRLAGRLPMFSCAISAIGVIWRKKLRKLSSPYTRSR